jgi:hypothetical protein
MTLEDPHAKNGQVDDEWGDDLWLEDVDFLLDAVDRDAKDILRRWGASTEIGEYLWGLDTPDDDHAGTTVPVRKRAPPMMDAPASATYKSAAPSWPSCWCAMRASIATRGTSTGRCGVRFTRWSDRASGRVGTSSGRIARRVLTRQMHKRARPPFDVMRVFVRTTSNPDVSTPIGVKDVALPTTRRLMASVNVRFAALSTRK